MPPTSPMNFLFLAALGLHLLASAAPTPCPKDCDVFFTGCEFCHCDADGVCMTDGICETTAAAACADEIIRCPALEISEGNCDVFFDGCSACDCSQPNACRWCGEWIGERRCLSSADASAMVCPNGCKRWFNGCEDCSCLGEEDCRLCIGRQWSALPHCSEESEDEWTREPEVTAFVSVSASDACDEDCDFWFSGCGVCRCAGGDCGAVASCGDAQTARCIDPPTSACLHLCAIWWDGCRERPLVAEEAKGEWCEGRPWTSTPRCLRPRGCESDCGLVTDGCSICVCDTGRCYDIASMSGNSLVQEIWPSVSCGVCDPLDGFVCLAEGAVRLSGEGGQSRFIAGPDAVAWPHI